MGNREIRQRRVTPTVSGSQKYDVDFCCCFSRKQDLGVYTEHDTIVIKLMNKRIFLFKEIGFFGGFPTANGVCWVGD